MLWLQHYSNNFQLTIYYNCLMPSSTVVTDETETCSHSPAAT